MRFEVSQDVKVLRLFRLELLLNSKSLSKALRFQLQCHDTLLFSFPSKNCNLSLESKVVFGFKDPDGIINLLRKKQENWQYFRLINFEYQMNGINRMLFINQMWHLAKTLHRKVE